MILILDLIKSYSAPAKQLLSYSFDVVQHKNGYARIGHPPPEHLRISFLLSDFGRPIFAIAVLIPPQQQYTYCEAESQVQNLPFRI